MGLYKNVRPVLGVYPGGGGGGGGFYRKIVTMHFNSQNPQKSRKPDIVLVSITVMPDV